MGQERQKRQEKRVSWAHRPPCHQDPSAQALPPSARETGPRTESGQPRRVGIAVAPRGRAGWEGPPLSCAHLGLQQVHTARDAVQDHALGVLILLGLERVEEPPELT